jgi:acyl-homoserine lactone synthase
VIDGVHVVTHANRHLYEDALDQSYRLRYRIYIQELKWRGLPPRDDQREIDQYDTPDAVHLLYLENTRVVGGTRLFPSTEPHMLSEAFSHFASIRGVPRQPDIAEWTRFYVTPERREEHKASRVGSIVLSSMIDYALHEGLTAVSALMNTFWLPRFLGYGWRVRPLGLPDVHDGEWLVAGTIDISHEALAGIRRAHGLEDRSALVRVGKYRPFIRERSDVPAVA